MDDQHESFDAELDGFPVASDAEHLRAREPLEVLVSRFADQVRRGESPSIEDYARRYPDMADEIRDLFPLAMTLERLKIDKEVDSLRRNVPDEFPIRQLGGYRLARELGRGGMGIVFEAIKETTGRRFAIKLLPWRFAADRPQWKERFHREAATIARLRHPNIVRVYAFGMSEGYCFYVMELIDGVGLDKILHDLREVADPAAHTGSRRDDKLLLTGVEDREGAQGSTSAIPNRAAGGLCRNSWSDFANIGMQVALALGHAHKNGVIHNDVKPANLLLKGTGEVIVTDFGIGGRPEADLSGEGDYQMGTLRYMAPERLLGRCDVRSDIYSLGATLYEFVTQSPAFDAQDRPRLVELILQSRPRPLREIIPQVPRSLERVILNAMAPEPMDRYPSAEALAADLLRFLNGQRIKNRRPGLVRREMRRLGRFLTGRSRKRS